MYLALGQKLEDYMIIRLYDYMIDFQKLAEIRFKIIIRAARGESKCGVNFAVTGKGNPLGLLTL